MWLVARRGVAGGTASSVWWHGVVWLVGIRVVPAGTYTCLIVYSQHESEFVSPRNAKVVVWTERYI